MSTRIVYILIFFIKTTSKETFTKKDTATFNSDLAICYNNETYLEVRASQQKYNSQCFVFILIFCTMHNTFVVRESNSLK